jgi:hypothetical protein
MQRAFLLTDAASERTLSLSMDAQETAANTQQLRCIKDAAIGSPCAIR